MTVLVESPTHGAQAAKASATSPHEEVPAALAKDFCLLSKHQRELMLKLCQSEGDRVNHLFEGWLKSDVEGSTPAFRRQLISQLEKIDKDYPSGLTGYLNNARYLLEQNGDGVANVDYLKGWKAVIPQGETFEMGTDDYSDVEKLGMRELSAVGFVLAAGRDEGLGCTLPIELATGTTHLQLYIESILAIERKYGNGAKLPLCIMTSDDTNAAIVKILEEHDNYGMTHDQITIVNQGLGVPTLCDSDAKLILNQKNRFNVLTTNHGQGDVHALLHKHNVAKTWKEQGTEWIVFLEDTNGLVFHNLALMLGVSVKYSLVMNMMAFPRRADEAVESVVKLVNEETNETRTMSVDYDQLDPLLRSSGYKRGDETNDKTGFSSFPGNTKQFVLNLDRYIANLERTNGIMPEFVVKAEQGTLAHLECRMQDISTVLSGRDALKVGYTCVASEYCFSPVDTDAEAGSTLQQMGMMPRCIESGEADQYAAHCNMMRSIGCEIAEMEPRIYNGVTVSVAPQIVIKPDAACFPSDYTALFPNPEKIKISSRSSLVVSGPGVIIDSLDLDGALVVRGSEGVEEQVIKNRVVKNDGWSIVADEDSVADNVAKRGYRLEKKDTETVVFSETLMDAVGRLTACG